MNERAGEGRRRAGEERRGRRASWVALALAAIACAAAFVFLGDRYRADRYERLRAHVTRPARFAIEAAIDSARAAASRATVLVSIDDLEAAPPPPPGYRTLDSLTALASTVTLEGEMGHAALATALARAGTPRIHAVAIPGRTEDLDLAALADAFAEVRLDRPAITGYLDEGEASWATRRAVETLETQPGEVFIWIRFTELLPPVVEHSRFRVPRALNERVAVDVYLGRLCAFLRAARIPSRVLVTDARASEVRVAGGGELLRSLEGVVMRAPALAGVLFEVDAEP